MQPAVSRMHQLDLIWTKQLFPNDLKMSTCRRFDLLTVLQWYALSRTVPDSAVAVIQARSIRGTGEQHVTFPPQKRFIIELQPLDEVTKPQVNLLL